MSGWAGRGPRARAASTSSAKAASRSGGTARSHSAVICLTRTFAASRCSRSCLDLFVTWTSSGIPGISADWGSHFAPIADACPAARCNAQASGAPASRCYPAGITSTRSHSSGREANHFYSPVASAIALASADAGVEVVQGAMLVNDDRELLEIPSALRDGRCDAAFVLGAEFNAEAVEGLRATGCPTILVDGYSEGDALDSVVTDNATGARITVEHLIAAGHRDIALLGTQPDCYPSIRDRRTGYIQAIEAGGLPTHFIDISYVFEEAAAVEAVGYVRRHPAVTAIFGANDWAIIAFMRKARHAELHEQDGKGGTRSFGTSQELV